jgi:hypothetical protein
MNNKLMVLDNITDGYIEIINTSFADLFQKTIQKYFSFGYSFYRIDVDKINNTTIIYLN